VVVCGFCAGVLLGALFWFCLFVGAPGVEMRVPVVSVLHSDRLHLCNENPSLKAEDAGSGLIYKAGNRDSGCGEQAEGIWRMPPFN
jgi:hypothetical protein